MSYKLVGRSLSSDYNDCVVIAFSQVMNIGYDTSHLFFQSLGRSDGKGVYTDRLGEILISLGFELLPQVGFKLKDLLPRLLSGKYFCRTKDHAFCIIDGLVIDCNVPDENVKVERIYERK